MDDVDQDDGDDGFGPGSDLVLSFLGVVLLLIGITIVTGLPKPEDLVPTGTGNLPLPAQVVPDTQGQAEVAERDRLRAMVEGLQRDSRGLRQRAEQAEQALKDMAARQKRAEAQAASKAADQGRPPISVRCESLLQRASSGDAMTPTEQTELRKCT